MAVIRESKGHTWEKRSLENSDLRRLEPHCRGGDLLENRIVLGPLKGTEKGGIYVGKAPMGTRLWGKERSALTHPFGHL